MTMTGRCDLCGEKAEQLTSNGQVWRCQTCLKRDLPQVLREVRRRWGNSTPTDQPIREVKSGHEGERMWRVPSATRPGQGYMVWVNGDRVPHCECPDHQYRQRECKHIRAVRAHLQARRFDHPDHSTAAERQFQREWQAWQEQRAA